MRYCLLLLSLAALTSAGCVIGDLDTMILLDRSLAPDEMEYIKGLHPPAGTKMQTINVAGEAISGATTGNFKERCFFPIYGDQKIIASTGAKTAGAVFGEFPSLFPGLSRWLFFRWGEGATFHGNELSRRCWTFQLNPIIGYTHAGNGTQTLSWELSIGKGLLAIGNTPRSLEGGGLIFQIFWVLGHRSEYTVLETGF